ncbi:MAG: DUF2070 family protein [Nitrososphaerota archaeon]
MNGYVAGKIASRYRMLRGITTGRAASLLLMTLFSAAVSALTALNTHNWAASPTPLALILGSHIVINRATSKLYQSRCETFTTRRLDSLSVMELLTVTIGFSIYSALSALSSERWLASPILTASISLGTYLGYSVRRAMGGRTFASILSSLATPIAGLTLTHIHTGSITTSAAHAAVSLAVAVVSMETVRLAFDTRLSFKGVPLFAFGQAFFRSLLAGSSWELEKMLKNLSRENDVSNDLFVIRRESGRPISLVVTDVHPGPFRDVGSSTYPSLVQREMAVRGIESVVFKGLSSHEKNLASRGEAEGLAVEISERALKILYEAKFSKYLTYPRRTSLNGAKTLWWKMGGRTVCLMTLHPAPMEDLPSEIADGGDDLIPVDTHNCFDHGYRALDRESIEKLKELVIHLKSNNGAEAEELRVGFYRAVPSKLGLAEGMGPGGVSCLVIGGEKAEAAVVVADANNAVPWVRDLVMEVAARHGIGEAELCTTDTHCVNAVSLGGKGYHPLGEVVPREVLESIFEKVISGAVADMSRAEVAYCHMSSRYPVFHDVLESISGRISAGARIYLTALVASPALAAVAGLLV